MKTFFSIVLFLFIKLASAQLIYNDVKTKTKIKEAIEYMYNMETEPAGEIISQLQSQHPEHPFSYMMEALNLSYDHYPIEDAGKYYVQYQKLLRKCLKKSQALLNKDKNDPEGVFFALNSHSLLALSESEKSNNLKAVSEARKAYNFMKKGFHLAEEFPEFHFSNGLYNYYVEQYPETHPAVRPLMFFFPDGDKEKGLGQIRKAIKQGVFNDIEARAYLINIYLKYENRPEDALHYCAELNRRFPDNFHFNVRYAEALFAAGRYNQALKIAKGLREVELDGVKLAVLFFYGYYNEKHLNSDERAADLYKAAIKLKEKAGIYGAQYVVMAKAGLARIAHRSGDEDLAEELYEEVEEDSEYTRLTEEAEQYLDTH